MEIKEVFEPIVSFVKNFQKKEKDISKQAAKDRLKLVLMQDRASVSPDFFEMMKKEIIDVIKKYIEIDEDSLEVQLTRGYEAGLEGPALYANIPIKNIKPVASNGEELTEDTIQNITNAVADEILDEASKRLEDGEALVRAEIESAIEDDLLEKENNSEKTSEKIYIQEENEKTEKFEDDMPKTADVIAENVAKEMKKSAAKSAAATKVSSKKTVKKSSTAKTITKRTTKKETDSI